MRTNTGTYIHIISTSYTQHIFINYLKNYLNTIYILYYIVLFIYYLYTIYIYYLYTTLYDIMLYIFSHFQYPAGCIRALVRYVSLSLQAADESSWDPGSLASNKQRNPVMRKELSWVINMSNIVRLYQSCYVKYQLQCFKISVYFHLSLSCAFVY